MKLKTALVIFLLLIATIVSTLTLALEHMASRLEEGAKEIARTAESIRVAEEIETNVLIHNRNLYLPATVDKESSLIKIEKESVKLLLEANAYVSSPEEATLLQTIRQAMQDYFHAAKSGDRERTSLVVQGLIDSTDRFVDLNISQSRQTQLRIDNQNRVAARLGTALISVAIILMLIMFAFALLTLYRPLMRLKKGIYLYGEGDTSARVEVKGLKETQEIAQTFNAMADRLEQRRQDQLRFIASIAHDIRNPLNSISMASQLLMEKEPGRDHQLMEIVYRQVMGLDRLVSDLLDTTRIEAGHLELKKTRNEITSLLREVVTLHQSGTKLHTFCLNLPQHLILAEFDRDRIIQVVNNLISNAIKYSPHGGCVTVTCRRENSRVSISIHDEGIGIPKNELENIFKPFQRSSTTRNTIPGIGLGLSASRRIVDAHGGALKVESEPGKGTLVRFELPAELVKEASIALA